MEKVLTLTTFLKENRKRLIFTVVIAALAAVIVISLISVWGLNRDVKAYEAQVVTLNDKLANYETAAQRNQELTATNTALQEENKALTDKNSELDAANSELERQNGDLSKKYNGLSKPN